MTHLTRRRQTIEIRIATLVIIAIAGLGYFAQSHINQQVHTVRAEANTQVEQTEASNSAILDRQKELQSQLENAEKEVEKLKKQVSAPEPIRMARIVKEFFVDDYTTALAVFIGESGLNPKAMGWNCQYGDVSKACAKGDRHTAWSVDCGLTQLNIIGQTCPDWTFNPRENLKAARAKYDRRGWQPWVAHWSGGYKGNINRALAYAKEVE